MASIKSTCVVVAAVLVAAIVPALSWPETSVQRALDYLYGRLQYLEGSVTNTGFALQSNHYVRILIFNNLTNTTSNGRIDLGRVPTNAQTTAYGSGSHTNVSDALDYLLGRHYVTGGVSTATIAMTTTNTGTQLSASIVPGSITSNLVDSALDAVYRGGGGSTNSWLADARSRIAALVMGGQPVYDLPSSAFIAEMAGSEAAFGASNAGTSVNFGMLGRGPGETPVGAIAVARGDGYGYDPGSWAIAAGTSATARVVLSAPADEYGENTLEASTQGLVLVGLNIHMGGGAISNAVDIAAGAAGSTNAVTPDGLVPIGTTLGRAEEAWGWGDHSSAGYQIPYGILVGTNEGFAGQVFVSDGIFGYTNTGYFADIAAPTLAEVLSAGNGANGHSITNLQSIQALNYTPGVTRLALGGVGTVQAGQLMVGTLDASGIGAVQFGSFSELNRNHGVGSMQLGQAVDWDISSVGSIQAGGGQGTMKIGDLAYGVMQFGYLGTHCLATNAASGSIQLFGGPFIDSTAVTTPEAYGSILSGYGIASNAFSITLGSGNTSFRDGGVTASGFFVGDGAGGGIELVPVNTNSIVRSVVFNSSTNVPDADGRVEIVSEVGGGDTNAWLSDSRPRLAYLDMGGFAISNVTAIGTGATASGAGVAVGLDASAGGDGVAIGDSAVGNNFGVAIGNEADGTDYGTAIGRYAGANSSGTAIGGSALGDEFGAAIGYASEGTNYGVGIGRSANGNNQGVAIGVASRGWDDGVAIGNTAFGQYSGVAVGKDSVGYDQGTAVGYAADGNWYGVAVGYGSKGSGVGNVALGYDAVVSNNILYAVQLGAGTNRVGGSLQFRDYPLLSDAGFLSAARTGTNTFSPGHKLTSTDGTNLIWEADAEGAGDLDAWLADSRPRTAALDAGGYAITNVTAIGTSATALSAGSAFGAGANADTNGVAIGSDASGRAAGAAVGSGARADDLGASLGAFAYSFGGGAAVGHSAVGTNYGSAVGRDALGQVYGAAVGYASKGWNQGAAVGALADGTNYGAAVGYSAQGRDQGAAMGWGSQGYGSGAAVGRDSQGYDGGAVVGRDAIGYEGGAALGRDSQGYDVGVAAGYGSRGHSYGAAVGAYSEAYGAGNAALGYGAVVSNGLTYAVQLGAGTNAATGSLQFRSFPLLDAAGHIPVGRIADSTITSNLVDAALDAVYRGVGAGSGSTNAWYSRVFTASDITNDTLFIDHRLVTTAPVVVLYDHYGAEYVPASNVVQDANSILVYLGGLGPGVYETNVFAVVGPADAVLVGDTNAWYAWLDDSRPRADALNMGGQAISNATEILIGTSRIYADGDDVAVAPATTNNSFTVLGHIQTMGLSLSSKPSGTTWAVTPGGEVQIDAKLGRHGTSTDGTISYADPGFILAPVIVATFGDGVDQMAQIEVFNVATNGAEYRIRVAAGVIATNWPVMWQAKGDW